MLAAVKGPNSTITTLNTNANNYDDSYYALV